jgi:hypothetical protein
MRKIASALGLTLCAVALVGQLAAQTWQVTGPINRLFHSAILDPNTSRMIVFGGEPADPGNTQSLQNLNDVWRLTGAGGTNLSWTRMNPTGTAPAPRLWHSAVYDSASNRMIVFGGGLGHTSPCQNDVWILTNANGNGGAAAWVQLTPAGSAPAPRAQHGAGYDPNTNTMIVFGGQDCFATAYGDVWVLSNANGSGGTPSWNQLNPAGGGPGPRAVTGGVAYDPASNGLMVFGGNNFGPLFNDTWVLSNANGHGGTPTWKHLSPSGALPAARSANSTVYDPTSNRLTVFGGFDKNNNRLGDTWVLTNANGSGGTPAWTRIASSATYYAEARGFHTGVYNPSTNKMIIFGGAISGTLGTNDVWVLSHANGK